MLKRFFSYYAPYKALFTLDFSAAIIVAMLELAFPIMVQQVVDSILPTGNWSLIIIVSIGLLGVYAINTILHYVVTYYGHKLGTNIETDMRRDLYNHLQKQSFSYFDNRETGKLITRLTSDLFEIAEVAHHGPEDIFITLFTLTGAFILMMTVHVPLAVMTFILVPFIALAVAYFNKRMTQVNTRIYDDLAGFSAGIEASVGGIRVVQAFSNEDYELGRFQQLNQAYRKSKYLFYKMMAVSHSYNYFLMRLISLFALFFGAYFTIQGEISYGDLVAFILFANVFVRPIEKVNTMIESYPKGFAGFKRLLEEMGIRPEVQDSPDAVEVESLKGDIVYSDVSFSYEENQSILDDINLTIKAGETIAFVGPSGAGKTTICNLLPRFYDIDSGTITIDGYSIKDITLNSLREQIGVVQQDVFLFPGTIKENILYGKLDATDEEVYNAVRMANLVDVVEQLPRGLETVIGERGVKLSGGQKQRLSIARMFLKNPPILILDEATSALDTETEQAIQEALDSLSKGRTTLIIAHRLATIKNADRIVVVTSEGIEEQGSHDELIAHEGAYKALYDAQFS
ncbi:ABC transporter ATP-binding protein [Alkalibacterium pelagium]|uniref:Multidrug resistance ABC transporter ATP-binding and permease protein n=1 Tax=Alkalibacterium pelagium TaxID=426702 RepID=A0A1H7L0J4_9LACT|nr:ABC transporter ATP-binding protein [Alkalibacterium pelagium]GEN50707.1 multidrug ABC transporter ATP-binding protein [Alkalibacterium pelagium]SEK92310.1 ATP-binding cassette, subfamily B [Alkalibacterium pelagium]